MAKNGLNGLPRLQNGSPGIPFLIRLKSIDCNSLALYSLEIRQNNDFSILYHQNCAKF